jgi:hypothetical protein
MNYVRLCELRCCVMKPKPILHRLWCRLGKNEDLITVAVFFQPSVTNFQTCISFVILFLVVDLNLALRILTASYNNLLP